MPREPFLPARVEPPAKSPGLRHPPRFPPLNRETAPPGGRACDPSGRPRLRLRGPSDLAKVAAGSRRGGAARPPPPAPPAAGCRRHRGPGSARPARPSPASGPRLPQAGVPQRPSPRPLPPRPRPHWRPPRPAAPAGNEPASHPQSSGRALARAGPQRACALPPPCPGAAAPRKTRKRIVARQGRDGERQSPEWIQLQRLSAQ